MTSFKSILLGITGGIAAYKTAELVRLMVRHGVQVHVVMTKAACEFITPTTLQALSGNTVHTELWNAESSHGMNHIDLSRQVDAILIAPCSADFISKLARGSADDLLSTLCLARNCPLWIAPAMNKQMWENKATQRNLRQLIEDDISVLGPDRGEQACGEVGMGRMLEPEKLMASILTAQIEKKFAGLKVLITAGATQEAIDPVRAITNHSSGKMGFSLAEAAIAMGAEVTLVSGKSSLIRPEHCTFIQTTSAIEMHGAVMQNIASQDIFISVAAVADYRPKQLATQKIKKTNAPLTIELVPNPDILFEVASLPSPPFCVGFAAETENIIAQAEEKRKRKNVPIIIANHANAMHEDDNEVAIVDSHGHRWLPPGTKKILAIQLLNQIYEAYIGNDR